jgi:hypothetical protein
MTQDSTKRTDLDAEATTEEAPPADPTASQLFFGGHLVDLVAGKAPPVAPEVTAAPDAEKTIETPSMLFFGEHLEQAAEEPAAAVPGDPDPPGDEG